VTVQVTPLAPRTMALSAAVSATQDDPQTSNNAASAATTVKGAVATSYVSVTASGFSPAAAMIARGNAVQWNFLSGGSHSATDPHAPVLFDSGPRTPVDFYLSTPGFRFDWAGVFTVADTAGGLANGSVHVPVTASPSSGLRSTSFTITWANAPPPSGFVIEVQKRIPGGAWADWKAATTLLSATFKPGRTLGSYGFRSRLIDTVSGAVYGYSDVRSVMVHG
jgi:plastocyanin